MLHRAVFGTEINPFCNDICYAGWKAILLTWAWALAIWQIADFAKFLVSWLLQRAEDIQTHCKHTDQPEPAWVKAVNFPGVAGDRLMRVAYKPIAVRLAAVQLWHDLVAHLLSANSWEMAQTLLFVRALTATSILDCSKFGLPGFIVCL